MLTQHKGDEVKQLVNLQNNEGNTPLHWAALNGHLEAVELLVKSGGDCKVCIHVSSTIRPSNGLTLHIFFLIDQKRGRQDSNLRSATEGSRKAGGILFADNDWRRTGGTYRWGRSVCRTRISSIESWHFIYSIYIRIYIDFAKWVKDSKSIF